MRHTHISNQCRAFDLKLDELWQYRDLIWLFTKRSFQVKYKQTVLGPLWLFINPLLTALFQMILFGSIAKLSTDGIPQILFYLSGTTLWSFFSGRVSTNANTFTANARLFGKVYFPRLAIPVSEVISGIIQLGIQFILLFVIYVFFFIKGQVTFSWWCFAAIPLIILNLGLLGMGLGSIISSFTTKYRDLTVLTGFGLQLLMYASPIVYPVSALNGILKTIIMFNPLTAFMELFRHVLFGVGSVSVPGLILSSVFSVGTALIGIVIFNKIERTFIDTV